MSFNTLIALLLGGRPFFGSPTPAAPDRLSRRYKAAICQFSCYDDFVTLPEPAASDPNRWAN